MNAFLANILDIYAFVLLEHPTKKNLATCVYILNGRSESIYPRAKYMGYFIKKWSYLLILKSYFSIINIKSLAKKISRVPYGLLFQRS